MTTTYDIWNMVAGCLYKTGITAEEAEEITRTTDIAGWVEEYGRCDTVIDTTDICVVPAGSPQPEPFEEE